MTEDDGGGETVEDSDGFRAFQERVAGTNISEQTLLATDYLNHFNEIVMLLEMIPDFQEGLDEAKEWAPRTYSEHFADSSFSDKDLAVEAYQHVPARYREPFERTIGQINQLIALTISRLETAIEVGDEHRLRLTAVDQCRDIQKLMDVASAIIHGDDVTMSQTEIDHLLAD